MMKMKKQIMYGVTDFVRMRTENGRFVDRTGRVSHGGDVALCEEIR